MGMKNITVTYEALVLNNGEKEFGEAAFTMLIDADLAEKLADGRKYESCCNAIEKILTNVEFLRGRYFVAGSIKDIR